MSTASHYVPFQREHKHLEEVASGRKHIKVDMAKIADLADGDPADEIALEIYEAEISSQGTFKPFINVEKPTLIDEMWVVQKFLSEYGQQAYDSLKAGVLFDYKTKAPDFPATEAYYDAMMAKGQIEMRFVDLLTETKSEELRELRNRLVYFKLRGQRKGDVIHGMVEDAA